MPQVGVNTLKSISFRGVAQEFGNTYHYTTNNPLGTAVVDSLVDAVVGLEKPIFSNAVSYLRARAWSSGGTKAENNMIIDKALTGAGGQGGGSTDMDRERAFLVRFRAGNDSRGNPVYLRKWWHLDLAIFGGSTISAGQKQNTAQLTQAQKDQLVAWANSFKNITAGGIQWELVAESGRQIDGNTAAHPYIEHRQLGDMWRG